MSGKAKKPAGAAPTLDWRGTDDEQAREVTRKAAYEAVFSTPNGRLVLADILLSAGVGMIKGPVGDGVARAYHDGREDCALEIAEAAKLAKSDVAAVVLTDGEGLEDGGREFEGGD